MRKTILDQPIDILNMNQAVYFIKMALINPKQLKIITLNPEMIISATTNLEFQAALNNAQLIVPDGTGIVWALKKINKNQDVDMIERIPGIELGEKILEYANEFSKKVAFYGGEKKVLEKMIENFSRQYKKIEITNAIHGFEKNKSDEDIAQEIAGNNPNVVFVALGSPRQEIWINKFSSLFPKSIMIGVGGSFDVWSGMKKRAPQFFRNFHLEWLYRILSEPKRIPRLLKSHPIFVYKVLTSKS